MSAIVCMMDNILIYGRDQAEQNDHLLLTVTYSAGNGGQIICGFISENARVMVSFVFLLC